jgi:hypothetical protein
VSLRAGLSALAFLFALWDKLKELKQMPQILCIRCGLGNKKMAAIPHAVICFKIGVYTSVL